MSFVTSSPKSSSARVGLLCMSLAAGLFATAVHAMVPPSERAVLDAIWYGTGGQLPGGTESTWINRGGWGIPVFLGISECGSYGVTCIVDQGQEHVSAIALDENGLTGQLPPSLSDLPFLEAFGADSNDIAGSIPELSGLTHLAYFSVEDNQLIGSIPSLTGLASLDYFNAAQNQLDGNVPALVGLNSLQVFFVYDNHLTGPIPSLAGLANLNSFAAENNQFTGPLPALANMTALAFFAVSSNNLNGAIPPLTGLPNLRWFIVRDNHLEGPIPSLSELTSVQEFDVSANQLTGLVPAAPPNVSFAQLCPNRLTIIDQPSVDSVWDAATGSTPWWATPFATNSCDELLFGDFEYPGGGP